MTASAHACERCGFANPAGFKFCGQCGAPIGERARAAVVAPSAAERRVEAEAERRQLTVMFCDLAGSTALADQLDAEEFRDIVSRYQRVTGEAIERFQGYVAQYLGDGLLVYFGYPEAHEDAPRRAVHAALGILEAVAGLSSRLREERGIPLGVRIGIHTGEVVTGDVGRGASQEQLALGQTPNVAARLQAAAEIDTVIVSSATYRLVREFFTAAPLGSHALKGVTRPVEVFRILRETGVRTKFDSAAERQALSPLIGREQPLGVLMDRFTRARGGSTQTVLIEAAPGIGKSRLLKALKDELQPQAPLWWHAGCSPYASDTPLFPLTELVENAIGVAHDAPPERKREQLTARLHEYGLASTEALELLGRLLSIAAHNPDLGVRITPQREKAQVLELLLNLIHRAAAERPIVVAVEDLHWIDPSTLELIRPLVQNPRPAQLMLVLTFRPAFDNPWSAGDQIEHLTLDHLPPDAAAGLAERVAGRPLPADVVARIVEKTDGVPLFVEELTRGVVESGQLAVVGGRYVLSGPLSSLEIPDTLQDSLMARLDRLHDLKEVAQLASVLGREFSYELMAASYPALADLAPRLGRLVDAGLFFRQGTGPTARYVFKHALLQDAAYGSLLKSRRRQHHERVANAIEQRFGALADSRPEMLAHHFTEAGLAEPAIRRWQQAGQISLGRSANLEAINHLNRALALLDRLPSGPDRDRQELALQTALAAALNTTRGYASPDVERAFARARAICDALGDARELFWNVRGQWAFYVVRGDLRASRDLGEQLLRVALADGDPTLLVEAHYALGNAKFWTGDLAGAFAHFDSGLRAGDLSNRLALRYTGQHTGVLLLAQSGWLRWLQGFPDEARTRSDEALALADEISHPLSVTMALFFSIWVHQFRGEIDAVRDRAQEVITRSREQGLFYELLGSLFMGWTMASGARGDRSENRAEDTSVEGGLQLIRLCLDMNRASGARLAHTYYLSLLLETYIRLERVDEARKVLAEAFQTVETTGETFWLPELHRLAGELELAADPSGGHNDAAVQSFRQALALAQSQGAGSLELRATRSLEALGAS